MYIQLKMTWYSEITSVRQLLSVKTVIVYITQHYLQLVKGLSWL
jgi:hypothetical protein